MSAVSGKSVIITGGAGEIARAVASQFLACGAQVLLMAINGGVYRVDGGMTA